MSDQIQLWMVIGTVISAVATLAIAIITAFNVCALHRQNKVLIDHTKQLTYQSRLMDAQRRHDDRDEYASMFDQAKQAAAKLNDKNRPVVNVTCWGIAMRKAEKLCSDSDIEKFDEANKLVWELVEIYKGLPKPAETKDFHAGRNASQGEQAPPRVFEICESLRSFYANDLVAMQKRYFRSYIEPPV